MQKYIGILISIISYFIYKRKTYIYEILLVCQDVDLAYKFKNKRYSPLLDSIGEYLYKLDKSVLKIIPGSTYSDSEIFGKILNINNVWLGSIYFKSIINRVFNRKITIGNRRINAWNDILKQIQPKLIIAIQPSHELCIAAKSNNIYTLDLQHGVISTDGAGYYSCSYRDEYDQRGWPDCILCWDKHTQNWINERYQDFVTTRVIGNPFILRIYKNDVDDELVNEANKKLNENFDSETINKKILVTTQWGYEHLKGILALGIPQSVVEFIKIGDVDYEWWIRFHPVTLSEIEKKNVYKICSEEFLGLTNVQYTTPTSLPLPLLLNKADLHITYSSATVKEASLFSVKSAMLFDDQEKLKEWFSGEIKKGDAYFVKNSSVSLEQWINKHSGRIDKDYSELDHLSEKYEQFIDDLVSFLDTNNSDLLFNKHSNN